MSGRKVGHGASQAMSLKEQAVERQRQRSGEREGVGEGVGLSGVYPGTCGQRQEGGSTVRGEEKAKSLKNALKCSKLLH